MNSRCLCVLLWNFDIFLEFLQWLGPIGSHLWYFIAAPPHTFPNLSSSSPFASSAFPLLFNLLYIIISPLVTGFHPSHALLLLLHCITLVFSTYDKDHRHKRPSGKGHVIGTSYCNSTERASQKSKDNSLVIQSGEKCDMDLTISLGLYFAPIKTQL